MTTLTVEGLEALLGKLGLTTPIPAFKSADVQNKPLDIGRSYLADIVGGLAKSDPETAYKSIHWPNNIFNGDLAVILPRLSHGADSTVLGFDLTQQVGVFFHLLK